MNKMTYWHLTYSIWILQVVSIACYKLPHLPFTRSIVSRVNDFSLKNSPQSVQFCKYNGQGCVLIAAPNQSVENLAESVVLITEKDESGTIGQKVNKPGAFTMGDMAYETEHFRANKLFAGGDSGQDTAIMIHKYDLGGYTSYLGNGIYIGGSKEAREKIEAFQAHPREFKFIFNHVHWAPGVLEKEIKEKKWEVCEVPVDMLVRQDIDSDFNLWEELRTSLNLPLK